MSANAIKIGILGTRISLLVARFNEYASNKSQVSSIQYPASAKPNHLLHILPIICLNAVKTDGAEQILVKVYSENIFNFYR